MVIPVSLYGQPSQPGSRIRSFFVRGGKEAADEDGPQRTLDLRHPTTSARLFGENLRGGGQYGAR